MLQDAIRPGTLWFGWSGKTAAHTSKDAHIAEHEGVEYATIDLSEDLYKRFYLGFANGTLWPLLHFRLNLIEFHREQLEGYRAANEAFAEALAKLVKPDDLIWVHDYHLIPLAAALRRRGLRNRIGFFLHVPFVPATAFAVLPQGEELLGDFCAYDVIGFQTETHRQDFVDCIRRILGYPVDPSGCMSTPMRSVDLIVSPVGIDGAQFARRAELSARSRNSQRLAESLAGRCLMIGVDRLDYSKGLPNRFEAFNRLLTRFPQHRSKVSFLQIAAPSREEVPEYAALRPVLNRMAGDINARHGAFDWVPLRYMSQPLARSTLAGFYRHACVGVVTPLTDGMNFVAARIPGGAGCGKSRRADAVEIRGCGELLQGRADRQSLRSRRSRRSHARSGHHAYRRAQALARAASRTPARPDGGRLLRDVHRRVVEHDGHAIGGIIQKFVIPAKAGTQQRASASE